jgi:molecular chaperone DnaK
VPAYFNDAQRQATKDAGEIAGLKVERIINEPTAAALAYGLDKGKNEKIAVFDLGGGTFDVSILDVGDGVFEVLSTNGDTHLGGDDWDQALINHLASEFKNKEGIDLTATRWRCSASRRPRERQEGAQPGPADHGQPAVHHGRPERPQAPPGRDHPQQVRVDLRPALPRLREPCDTALKDAGIDASKIDEVILVGGSTRIPKVQEMCQGDLRQRAQQERQPRRGRRGRRRDPGRRARGRRQGRPAARRHPAQPGRRDHGRRDDQAHREEHHHPDEQEGDLLHRRRQPAQRADPRPAGRARVRQGQPDAGQFELAGIAPAPRGMPQIEVEFALDANGILQVTAVDKGTGKKADIRIENSGGLRRRDREDEGRRRGPRRGGQEATRGRRREEPGRCAGQPDPQEPRGARRQGQRRGPEQHRERPVQPRGEAQGRGQGRRSRPRSRSSAR